MHPFLRDLKNLIFDTLFPVQCLGCGKEGFFLCAHCQTTLPGLRYQQCIICRMPSVAGITHKTCRGPALPDGLVSIFDYGDPLPAQTIVWGKYKWLPDIYRILGGLMIERLESEHYRLPGAELTLCPIPLSKERLRWRGFNQSEIIARELSRHFSWPVTPLLQRIKNTKTQKDLTRAERFTNIARSFTLADGQAITNKNIILIDDVITTGATLLEAVKVLKSAGASQVWCLTLARD